MKTAALLVTVWGLLGALAAADPITINTPYNASVYVRTHGGAYHLVATETPALVEIPDAQTDVRVWARISTFQIATGEYHHVVAGSALTIPMTVGWDPVNLGLAAVGVVGVLAFGLARILLQRKKTAPVLMPLGQEGSHIGSYQIVRLIARGGMGAVYHVVDPYGDSYALKVPESAAFNNMEFRDRFRREVDIGKQLHHENIVRLFDCNLGEVAPEPFLVMELIDGPSLEWVLRHHGMLPTGEAVALAQGILAALEYGHRRGVIHRDIKPGNVLMADGVPKVTDYGIARLDRVSELTGTGTAIGTPRYMAPEQIDAKFVDVRADVYAVGVILFECLTGKTPFEADDPMQLIAAKLSSDPPAPSSLNAEVPPFLDAIVVRALACDPNHRYPTAQAFHDDLSALGLG